MEQSKTRQVLKEIFGYNEFRYQQKEIIQRVINGKDALVIMPTGGGKSLCYQIPALINDGLTIVISPLIALMNDQVSALKQLDINAAALHSNIQNMESNSIYQSINDQDLDILYVSPEKVLSSQFYNFIKNHKISLFAIDEAHCVSVWGNDFRPEYVRLSILKEEFPSVPTIALTATADQSTQKDIQKQLKLNQPQVFLSSFERENIHTEAKAGLKRIEQILNYISERPDTAGIVYCLSRKSTESVADKLKAKGYSAEAYHAGKDAASRRKIQQDFQNDELDIVCATIAFGMGIDKPNIRWVIHYNLPKNIEAYYQEIGRGGRDGEAASSLLFYSWADYLNLKKFIDESQADDVFKKVQNAKLERMWQFANALSCRTNLVLNYFGEYRNEKCNHCDNCLNPPQLFEGSKYAQMALSAIIRTHENVGVNSLVDILRGSQKAEIMEQGFHQIKTFGVGREVPFLHWKHFITQMINQGILSIDFSDSSRLKITPLSKAVLKGERTIELSKFVSPQEKKARDQIKKVRIDVSNPDQILLEHLKTWRSGIARKQKVPAYVVLHDKSLLQIASLKPTTNEKLLSVDGIGNVKLEKYGKAIISLVARN